MKTWERIKKSALKHLRFRPSETPVFQRVFQRGVSEGCFRGAFQRGVSEGRFRGVFQRGVSDPWVALRSDSV